MDKNNKIDSGIDWEALWERKKQQAIQLLMKEYTNELSEFLATKQSLIDRYGSIPPNMPMFSGDRLVKIVSELGINVKHAGYFALLPENLDLQARIKRYPVTDYKFVEDASGHTYSVNINGTLGSIYDIERMIYLLGLLSSIPAKNKDLSAEDIYFENDKDEIDEKGFVPINSTIIRNHFKDYLSYLDYLIKTGIIICNKQYIPGEKSMGYKYAPKYDDVPLVRYVYKSVIDGGFIVEPVKEEVFNKNTNHFVGNPLLIYPYLTYWYNQKKFKIDEGKAKKYAYLIKQKKFKDGYDSWDINRNKWSKKRNDFCKKYPKTQYKAIIHNISAISLHDYDVKIDTNVHRLHSVITNMEKNFRNFLAYDRKPLVAIDIGNSQPYLMCLLFNPLFWEQDSTISLNIGMLPVNIQSLFSQEHLLAIKNYITEQLVDNEELNSYKEKASEGIIYNYLADVSNARTGTQLKREDAKTMMLIVFFSKNRFFHQKGAELKRLFAELYPKIYGLIKLIKRDNHAAFACLLQSIESEIILHRCCKKIWEEKPAQVPIFTIHDCIATAVENEEYVTNKMREELTEAIGVAPRLKIEKWNESELPAISDPTSNRAEIERTNTTMERLFP